MTAKSQSPAADNGSPWRDAKGFWEPRRVAYNAILAAVVAVHMALQWSRIYPGMMAQFLGLLVVLGVLANLCYSAAYLLDIALRASASLAQLRRRRRLSWLAGTAFAVLIANYWMVDEVLPPLPR